MENSGGRGGVDTPNPDNLDNLSNLLINSYEDDAAALDAYELEMERNLQETLILEKEHHNQRLFQSFQKSACNVAQMFKDKSNPQQTKAVLSAWESFQNAAGAITVLYKESLEACRVHMELGVHLGQQRKLKDIINWVKKKKKRSIRKDELVAFLIGKQYPSQNQMFSVFGSQASNPFNVISSSESASTAPMFPSHRHSRTQQLRHQQRNTLITTTSGNNNNGQTSANSVGSVNTLQLSSQQSQLNTNNTTQLNLISGNDNSNGSEVETNSDLATFREALIMHNRSRDTPPTFPHTTSSGNHHHHTQPHNHHTQPHNHHAHPHHTSASHCSNNMVSNEAAPPNCDDLDCFFCEQIATHIEHRKRTNASHFDMDSPTRKRGRFY